MLYKNLSNRKRLDKEQNQSFWNESLSKLEPEPLDLSFLKLNSANLAQDSRRPFGSNEYGSDTLSELNFSFDKKIWSDLDRLKKQHTISPYVYGQSILAILLNKYTGQDEFCIKHSIATKIKKRFYCTYVDTCVIPYDFQMMPNVMGVIKGSQEFIKLYREITPDCLLTTEESLRPNIDLANVAFVQVGSNDTACELVKVDIQRYSDITSLGDLVFAQEVRKETVNYRVLYRPNKIDAFLLKGFIECYKKLFIEVLEELLKNKTSETLTSIRNYTILPIDQYKQVVQAWNNTDEVYVGGMPINLLFEEHARKTPENVAVIYQDTQIRYRELNEKVNRLTSYLKKRYAINPDTLVAVCLERNEHMIIGILAVLKAGGAYVPLDSNYPDDRIAYILNDTNTKLILTNEINKKRIEQIINICPTDLTENSVNSRSEVLALDNIDFQEQLLLEPSTNPNVSITSNNLAYIIYTSGTTGKPKGVMIEHRSVVNLRNDLSKRYKLGENDNNEVILQFANYAFDASVEQIVLSLLNGYSLLLLPNHLWLDKDNFYQYLSDHKVTHIHAVPSVLEQYNFRNIKTLKRLIFGGETLTRTCYSKTERSSEVVVINEYGPTETTITSIVNVVKNEDLSIGVPIFNTKAYVLSRDLIPLPIGAVGELYIGGIGLARGYLNKPELTAERFIPDPFQTQGERTSGENCRLYKTGDLVRWLPNGHLEYIGRNDFQVKIRGYRIELGEIESVLSSYEGITKSVVLAKERLSKDGVPTGNKYLIGYYVSPLPAEEDGVLQYLQARLPEYMVPHILVYLPTLPLTNSGKLDIKALPEPSLHLEDGYVSPQNELESRLCNLWAKVLDLNEGAVGVRDDFFRLGGDSILAIRLVSKINNEFKSQLKARDILESRCVLKLIDIISKAKDVDEEKKSYAPFSLVKVEDYKSVISNINLIEDIYPASSLQAEMLSQSAFNNREAYHNISSYLVHAKFNKDKLLSIVNQLIKKHELLRACFVPDKDRGWSVIIYKSVPISYQIYTNKNGKELIADERSNTFDYARPGLFRIVINDLGDKFNLIFSFHHAIEDGWSFASLINEFGRAYIYNQPIEERLNLRYGEFVRDELTAMRSQENISFWKSYLKGSIVTKVNETFDKDKIEGGVFNSFFKLSSEQSESVHRISRALKISVDSIFLYTYLKTLSYFCKHSDVVIGWVVNNRLEKEGGDKMFGLFLNTIPLRLNFETIKTDISGLLDIFNNKLKLQEYKQLPYGRIKELFKHELYDFVFNFVHLHILKDSANSIESVDGYERTNILFALTVVQKGETTFLLDISAQEGYVTKDFLEHFMAYYQECFSNLLKIQIADISANEALPFSRE